MGERMILPEPEKQGAAPAADEQKQTGKPAAAHTAPGRRTILIVDDVAVMRLRMRPQLEESGYRVLEAEDGEKAIEVIRHEKTEGRGVDLVISDVSMPVMDGIEMIRTLRQDPLFHQLPIIVCTARGELAVVRQAKTIGVQGFLVKPVTKHTLIAAVQRELK